MQRDLHNGAFVYRPRVKAARVNPGTHKGRALGAGDSYQGYAPLYSFPVVKQLDLLASARDPLRRWLVRLYAQPVTIPVHLVVDISASMNGALPIATKRDVVRQLATALAASCVETGDPLGILAVGSAANGDFWKLPITRDRAAVRAGIARLLKEPFRSTSVDALHRLPVELGKASALVFLVSDFYCSDVLLTGVLGSLARHHVVPVVVWPNDESEPPARWGLVEYRDAESTQRRLLCVYPGQGSHWRRLREQRREQLQAIFSQLALRPFFVTDYFDSNRMTAYFAGAW